MAAFAGLVDRLFADPNLGRDATWEPADEAVVQTGTDWDLAFDALAASVGIVLSADRTLGGLCDWVEAEASRPVDLALEGAATLKAAVIPIVLHYSTGDPLA